MDFHVMDCRNQRALTHCVLALLALIITVSRQTHAKEEQKGKLPLMKILNSHINRNTSLQFSPLNFTNGKLIWEGGSFPYEESRNDDHNSLFYNRAVIVAPIVGSIFIVFLVVVGVYSLRQYEIPDASSRGKDVKSPCENCTRSRATGIRYKIQSYVMRIFDVKQDAYLIRMNPRSRTENREVIDAWETLV